jgi:hypothetical protein
MKSENATQWLQHNPFRGPQKVGSELSVRYAGYYSIHHNVSADISPLREQSFLLLTAHTS